MGEKKILRVKEPHGGWDQYDTGLCNRILHWELSFELMEKLTPNFELVIEDRHWPEISLLDIPNTFPVFTSYFDSYIEPDDRFLLSFDKKNKKIITPLPITEGEVLKVFNGKTPKKLINNKEFYCDFGFIQLTKVKDYNEVQKNRPLRKIRLKHEYVRTLINDSIGNSIGIHIRRGSGVKYNEEDLNKLPKEQKNEIKLIKSRTGIEHESYKFYDNTLYFNIMDKILEINPSQTFYISHDLLDLNIEPFKKRYGKSIINDKLLKQIVYRYLISSKISHESLIYGNTLSNIVDLFALSFSSFMIGSPSSTWSDFARTYQPKTYFNVNDNIDTILLKYKSYHTTNII
jgi:hypothetical protein